jgi:hypothetical protein
LSWFRVDWQPFCNSSIGYRLSRNTGDKCFLLSSRFANPYSVGFRRYTRCAFINIVVTGSEVASSIIARGNIVRPVYTYR